MTTVYRYYVSDRISDAGLTVWIDDGVRQQIGETPYVRVGRALFEDTSGWYASKPAVLEAMASEIIAKAALLVGQADKLRQEAAALRAKEAEDDERYDRGLPPRMEVPS